MPERADVQREAGETAIHPDTALGHVHMVTDDLSRVMRFYREALGFREARRDGSTTFLSADGLFPFSFAFTEIPGAARRARTTGLYHAAILLPSRRDLARVFLHLRAEEVSLDGVADHVVSEALYLRDPDGNGLEIYADRPREQWRERDGQILMSTDPLDLGGLLAEARDDDSPWTGMPAGTGIGHVHLRVSDLQRAEAFYHGVLGFDVTVRTYPGALFLSAGGYHHHLGVNVWSSAGAPPAPSNSVGLRSFTVRVPERQELVRILRRARAQDVTIEGAVDHGISQAVMLRDGDGIGVALAWDRVAGRASPTLWREEPLDVDALLRE